MIGKSIERAESYLRTGKVIAIPTETVYGLAGNAYDKEAVRAIYALKKRPATNPLILHTPSIEHASALITHWPSSAKRLAEVFWPGPLTLLLPKKDKVPNIVTATLATVGIRVPSHPVAQALLQSLPFPLAAPSANPSGYISPTTTQHVADQLGPQLPYILDGGPCALGLESTIVGFDQEGPILYRLGSIPTEAIIEEVGPIRFYQPKKKVLESPSQAPGTDTHHYAPHTPLVVGDVLQLLSEYPPEQLGVLLFDKKIAQLPDEQQVVLSPAGDLAQAAQHLFAALRHLDKSDCTVIIAPRFPATGLGNTINERLLRASVSATSPIVVNGGS